MKVGIKAVKSFEFLLNIYSRVSYPVSTSGVEMQLPLTQGLFAYSLCRIRRTGIQITEWRHAEVHRKKNLRLEYVL